MLRTLTISALFALVLNTAPAFAYHHGGGGWGHGGSHGHPGGGHFGGRGHWGRGGMWIPGIVGGAAILGGAAYCWRHDPYTGERIWVCGE